MQSNHISNHFSGHQNGLPEQNNDNNYTNNANIKCNANINNSEIVNVVAGDGKIVLSIKKHHDRVDVRVEQIEPDLMAVGSSLDESRQLRRKHGELLHRLNAKEKELTSRFASEAAFQGGDQAAAVEAVVASVGDSWKELSRQLERRRQMLDQSVAFHESAQQFSRKMEQVQSSFGHVGVPRDVDDAQQLIKEHQNLKKGVLESSMSTLQEGQCLLERIQEVGLKSRLLHHQQHATTAASYGIEAMIRLLQSRRKQLDDLWLARRAKLEANHLKVTLESDAKQLSDWLDKDAQEYINKKDLGNSLPSALRLKDLHEQFEKTAKKKKVPTATLR